jgi:hypothetical protein
VLGRAFEAVDWSPRPLDLQAVKRRLVQAVETRLCMIEDSLGSSARSGMGGARASSAIDLRHSAP